MDDRSSQVLELAPWTLLLAWPARRWLVALATAAAFVIVVAVPTDLIDTAFFGREVPPTWWAWPSVLVSSLLGGILVATYVRASQPDRPASRRGGWVGGVLTYFAVGCPVCNKLVLLALGSAGAMTWFEPFQPVLQGVAVLLLLAALRSRLLGELSCATPRAGAMART